MDPEDRRHDGLSDRLEYAGSVRDRAGVEARRTLLQRPPPRRREPRPQGLCPRRLAGPPEGAIGFWQARVPAATAPRRPPVDDEMLLDCFARLEGTAEPAAKRFRYVLALFLMRRRRLRLEDTRQEGGEEVWPMRCTRSGARFQVVDPGLSRRRTGVGAGRSLSRPGLVMTRHPPADGSATPPSKETPNDATMDGPYRPAGWRCWPPSFWDAACSPECRDNVKPPAAAAARRHEADGRVAGRVPEPGSRAGSRTSAPRSISTRRAATGRSA